MARQRLTSRDIAALCGVLQTTVSRVLRGERYVSPEVREKVLAALRETGYVPNAAAKTMRTRASGAVGVIAGRITNPFYPQLLDAVSAVLTEVWQSMTDPPRLSVGDRTTGAARPYARAAGALTT